MGGRAARVLAQLSDQSEPERAHVQNELEHGAAAKHLEVAIPAGRDFRSSTESRPEGEEHDEGLRRRRPVHATIADSNRRHCAAQKATDTQVGTDVRQPPIQGRPAQRQPSRHPRRRRQYVRNVSLVKLLPQTVATTGPPVRTRLAHHHKAPAHVTDDEDDDEQEVEEALNIDTPPVTRPHMSTVAAMATAVVEAEDDDNEYEDTATDTGRKRADHNKTTPESSPCFRLRAPCRRQQDQSTHHSML